MLCSHNSDAVLVTVQLLWQYHDQGNLEKKMFDLELIVVDRAPIIMGAWRQAGRQANMALEQ